MKHSLRLLLLGIAVLLCAGLYILVPHTDERPTPTPTPTAIPVFSVSPEQIIGLSWDYAARTLSFRQDAGVWQYPADKRFPLDQDGTRFKSLFTALENITAQRYLPEITDPAEYGLDHPATVITVSRLDNTTTVLSVGMQNPVTAEYYLQVSGNDGVYLIDGALPQAFACGLFDLVRTDPVPDLSTADEYSVNGKTYQKDAQSQWRDEEGALSDTDFTAVLSKLRYSACIDYYADSDEVRSHEYGLAEGKSITVVCTADAAAFEWKLTFGNDYDEEHVIVSPAGSNLVYTLDRSISEALLVL